MSFVKFHKGKAIDSVIASKMSHPAKLVGVILVKYANAKGTCFPSLERLMEDASMAKTTVSRCIKELEAHAGTFRVKIVRRWRRRGPGRQANEYHLSLLSSGALPNTSNQSSEELLREPLLSSGALPF